MLRFMRSSQHWLIGVLLMLFSSRMISEVVQPFGSRYSAVSSLLGSRSPWALIGFRAGGGSWPWVGCVLVGVVICRAGICRFQSVRRSRWAARPESRCGASRGDWGARRRWSVESWRAMLIAAGSIGRRRRMRRPGGGRVGPSRPSWSSTNGCGGSCSEICSASTLRSRSWAGCGWRFPMIRRCGCLPRRSISRCM
jgi:hypothetical protein